MDTVWIRLTTLVQSENTTIDYEEVYMFGGGGVVRFNNVGPFTNLIRADGSIIARVAESADSILLILSKVRGTEGVLNDKPKKKAKSVKKKSK